MRILAIIFIVSIIFAVNVPPVFSEDMSASEFVMEKEQLVGELQWLQDETFVLTATKTMESLKKSGASITVITDKQLWNMGARNLMDALAMVPGIGITRNMIGMPEVEARGVKTLFSEKILFMINSHPVNNNLTNGGGISAYDDFNIEDIKRVEVIRGPGSALYGANAFLAIVNIITKKFYDVDEVEFSVGAGSYNTQKYNLLIGDTFKGVEFLVNFNFSDTNGFNGRLENDQQATLDSLLGTSASVAPGNMHSGKQFYNLNLELGFRDFTFQGKYVRKRTEPYIGFTYSLNDETKQAYDDYFLQLGYNKDLTDTITLETKVYRDHFSFDNFWELFPEGFGGVFPDGFLAQSSVKNTKFGGEALGTFQFNDANKVVLGGMAEKQKQFDVGFKANFNPLTNAPLSSFQDVSENWNWAPAVDRTLWAIYAQDIWDVTSDIRLIAGGRYDHYSDFGGTFNPRGSLIWEFIENYQIEVLYGEAFRAPTFAELYNINNPAVVGNPDLKPERISTLEVGIDAEIMDGLNVQATWFQNKITDIIVTVAGSSASNTHANAGEVKSEGVEMEIKHVFDDQSYWTANYTYQNARNMDTDARVAETPKHRGNIMLSLDFWENYNFFAHGLFKGSMKRDPADNRQSDVSGYVLLNTALTARNILPQLPGLELSASIFNLLNKKYVDPSPANTMPSDYPTPGISFFINLRYTFN